MGSEEPFSTAAARISAYSSAMCSIASSVSTCKPGPANPVRKPPLS